jgi:hypothetical protein
VARDAQAIVHFALCVLEARFLEVWLATFCSMKCPREVGHVASRATVASSLPLRTIAREQHVLPQAGSKSVSVALQGHAFGTKSRIAILAAMKLQMMRSRP